MKSERLKKTRGVSFEEIIGAEMVDIRLNEKRVSQNIMIFRYREYIWAVPYVEAEDHIFLKTLYPSRKYTKLYKMGRLS